MKDINEMSLEELNELLEAVNAKIAELEGSDEEREGEEVPAEGEGAEQVEVDQELVDALPDAIEALEEILDQVEGRKKVLKNMEKRNALRNRVAKGLEGTVVRKNEDKEVKTMSEVNYRVAWLKNLQGKHLTAEERTAVTASAAIPTETMNQIIGVLENNPLIAAVDVTYIPGNVTYPAEDTINNAAWVTMGSAATDSADSLKSISLAAYKLIKTVEITADVQAMSIEAFENWLVGRLANKIEKAIDAGILNGGGSTSGCCLGIKVSKTTEDGTYTYAGMNWGDICSILAALKSEYHQNASFVMNRGLFFGDVMAMTDSTGNRVVVADAQAPCKFNILGYPVIIDDNAATDELYFGDLKAYKFNFAKAPEVSSDDSVAFRTGSRVYRAMALADGKLGDDNAIVRFVRHAAGT